MTYDLTVDTKPQTFVVVVPDVDAAAVAKAVEHVKQNFQGADAATMAARVRLVSANGGPLLLDATVRDVLAMP